MTIYRFAGKKISFRIQHTAIIIMGRRRRLSIAFGAVLHASNGLALLPNNVAHYSSINRNRSQRRIYPALYSSSSSNGSSDDNEISQTNDSETDQTLLQRFGPTLKTAAIGFVGGIITAFMLSLLLFKQSFDYDATTAYQTTDMSLSGPTASAARVSLSESGQIQQSVTLYRSILDTLASGYVDDINTDEMLKTSVDSMLSSLDPYTEYLSQTDLSRRQKGLVGIGAFVMKSGVSPNEVTFDGKSASTIISGIPSAIKLPTQLMGDNDAKQKETFKVVLSLEGYAYDAGLRVGDELISIDGHSVTGDDTSQMPSLEEVRELLVGVPGTEVELKFIRPGVNGVQTITVKRKVVQFPSVPCATMLKQTKDGDIGYIRLRRFGSDAGESMEAAIRSLQSRASQNSSPTQPQEDPALAGLVLDLRSNSGGELFEAIKVASLFVPNNTYLGSSKGEGSMMPNQSYYSGKLDMNQLQLDNPFKSNSVVVAEEEEEASQQLIDPDKTRLVILTNKQTASASEFLAGIFQDLDIGVIVGNDKDTLGKGIGQRELPLPSGALKLTYHEFYTPSGRCVQRQYDQNKSQQSPRRRAQSKEIFYTVNGRSLSDRHGIQVDRRYKRSQSQLSESLSSSGAYYKYASEWHALHPSKELTNVDDAIFKDFQSFVLRKQQAGELKLEQILDDKHALQQMEQISKATNNRDLSLQSLERLKKELVKDLLAEFDACKEAIKCELELNLLSRDLPDSELIERSVVADELVKEATKILMDSNSYNAILNKPH